ncbi:MAG: DUF4147 domain-containing protein [Candidatus Cloacimonadaceae bacterium]
MNKQLEAERDEMSEEILTNFKRALSSFCRYPRLAAAIRERYPNKPPHILAIGKAAWQMGKVACSALKPKVPLSCVVLCKYGFYPTECDRNYQPQILEAAHPVPDENSILHSRRIMEWIKSIPSDEELCVLLSGGSSALFEIPASGYDLAAIRARHSLLLKSGLDIAQINAGRKECSAVKGGKAAKFFSGKSLEVYLLSDVPENDPSIIGSGPFYRPEISNHHIIGDNQAFLKQLAKHFRRERPNLPVRVSPVFIKDEVEVFARGLARYCEHAAPGIYIFGGECTLKVKGLGKGGRLSHLALSFLRDMPDCRNAWLCAFATDGNDNLADSAGALVTNEMRDRICFPGGMDTALKDFDSFSCLQSVGGIIPAFYSGCNVNDVMVLRKR